MKYNIPIVVVGYNRPAVLKRLLDSLAKAIYPQEVRLIISIDKSDDESICKIASAFKWKHGEKEVIQHKKHMGLRNHILNCGDLVYKYDAIIILEDDLFVSPAFYNYNLAAVDFYHSDNSISGISLYSHNYNETALLPFSPLIDNSDTYFLQIPSSWGQCYTKTHWQEFRNWYKKNQSTSFAADSGVPRNVKQWPDSSWKKYFYKYMIVNNKFFVYPRISLTTNFGDPGVHFDRKLVFQQVPLLTESKSFSFKKLSESVAVYDSHCEIVPNRLIRLAKFLSKYSFDVDLYGTKEKSHLSSNYVLTSRQCKDPIHSFARELVPLEANIVNKIKGSSLFLANTESCNFSENSTKYSPENLFYFFKLRNSQLDQIAVTSEIVNKKNQLLSDYEKKLINAKNISAQRQEELGKIEVRLKYNDALMKEQANVISIAENQVKDRETQIAGLQSSIKQRERHLEQALDTSKTLARMIREKDLLVENQNTELTKYKDELNAVLLQIEKQNAKIENLANENARNNKQLEVKGDETHKLNNELVSLKMSLNNSESKLKNCFDMISKLNNELDEKKSRLDSLEIELQKKSDNLKNNQRLLIQNSNTIREKSQQLLLLKDTLRQRDELIRSVEKSYTFRLGRLFTLPVKKLLRK